MTGMIREKLNTRLGGEIVREIVLKAGKIQKEVAEDDSVLPPPKPLSFAQLAWIEEQSAAIGDPEARLAFAELMKASLERSP